MFPPDIRGDGPKIHVAMHYRAEQTSEGTEVQSHVYELER